MNIKEEVIKQLDAGFVEVTESIMASQYYAGMQKAWEGQNVRSLPRFNKASPKEDFPLPYIDVLVNNIVRHALFSFIDDVSGYNQI